MDEPLSNLDAKLRVQMRTEISKLYQSLGTTFIYVTHDQVEALTMGTRIVVMKDGVIQQVDTPLNIYNTPNNLFVASFIGSPQMNLINGIVSEKEGKLYCKFDENNILLPEEKAKVLKEKGYVNKEVVFGIRPEHLDDNAQIIENNPAATLTGDVEVVERMGAESYIYFKSGNNNMTARVDGSTKAEPKDKIKLYVEHENIHVFDKETELRIC
jgi:multiple sugar transport system ATP-binding protein